MEGLELLKPASDEEHFNETPVGAFRKRLVRALPALTMTVWDNRQSALERLVWQLWHESLPHDLKRTMGFYHFRHENVEEMQKNSSTPEQIRHVPWETTVHSWRRLVLSMTRVQREMIWNLLHQPEAMQDTGLVQRASCLTEWFDNWLPAEGSAEDDQRLQCLAGLSRSLSEEEKERMKYGWKIPESQTHRATCVMSKLRTRKRWYFVPRSKWDHAYKDEKNPYTEDLEALQDGLLATTTYRGLTPASYAEHSSDCLLYTSPSPRDRTRSRMPSSA